MPGPSAVAHITAATSFVALAERNAPPVEQLPRDVPALRFHVRAPVMSGERLALTPSTVAHARTHIVELNAADHPQDAAMMREFIEFVGSAPSTVRQVFLEIFELLDFEILAGNPELHGAFAKHAKTFGELMEAALRQPAFDARLHQILNAQAAGGGVQALSQGVREHPALNAAMTRIAQANPRWHPDLDKRMAAAFLIFACAAMIVSSSVSLADVDKSEAARPDEDWSSTRQMYEGMLGVSVGLGLAMVACLARLLRNTSRVRTDLRDLAAAQAIGEAGDAVSALGQSALEDQLRVIGGASRPDDSDDEAEIEVVVRLNAGQADERQAGQIESLDADDHPDSHDAPSS